MDANVNLQSLGRFKKTLTSFNSSMNEESHKTKLYLKRVHAQMEQKHYELKRNLQMCRDQTSYDRMKQQLIEFERLFARFCEAASECIKAFNHQEQILGSNEKSIVIIDQKTEVLRQYLSNVSINDGSLSEYKPSNTKIDIQKLGTGEVGNFRNVRDVNDLLSRIPINAKRIPWREIEGGAKVIETK
ncbi:hypothetical protein [Hazenella coriacea]|uniref:Uncharacterized protein n=1 Tax=Hazenella coriacea TaxID=1179467 RepID=A0A4R3L9U5_9BACL|nr:hypothetical protein [Hazenella coriacea]TCS96871.1 hypothetical protein EDD58_101516 [Hazenella coriacea]